MRVIFQKKNPDDQLPIQATPGAGAYDFFSPDSYIIPPYGDVKICLNLKLKFSKRYALFEIERSSMAMKKKCLVGAKFIDSDYRGFIHAHLFNLSDKEVCISKGDRIIQGIFLKVKKVKFVEGLVESDTKRGEGAFGSTGGL